MILIWTTQSPVGNATARETLDAALAFAAYEQPKTMLFSGQAIHSLKSLAQAPQSGSKDLSKLLLSLELFDIERVYVSQTAMQQADLTPAMLHIAAQPLNADQIATLIQEATHVIRI